MAEPVDCSPNDDGSGGAFLAALPTVVQVAGDMADGAPLAVLRRESLGPQVPAQDEQLEGAAAAAGRKQGRSVEAAEAVVPAELEPRAREGGDLAGEGIADA